ncbi:unnamed protein product [Rhodiola kirilowii]
MRPSHKKKSAMRLRKLIFTIFYCRKASLNSCSCYGWCQRLASRVERPKDMLDAFPYPPSL